MAQAAVASGERTLGGLLKWVRIILISALIIISVGVFIRLALNYNKLGLAEVAVVHARVATETPRGLMSSTFYKVSPTLADIWDGKTYRDSFSSEVEVNEENPNLGVKIKDFAANAEFFRENTPIILEGAISASSLAEQTRIAVFCSLESYKNGRPIPVQLFGTTATGTSNTGLVFKNQDAEFQARCVFPEGLKAEKPRNAKIAKLIVTYDFTTKATQKLWFLDKQTLFNLQGKNPFNHYQISDPQLDSRRKVRSKSTAGPINLAFNIDLPQPLTDATPYILTVQLSNNLGWLGNLEKLEALTLQFPAARNLELIAEGEAGFNMPDSKCAFTYSSPGEEEFKVYEIKPEYLADINRECNEDDLRSLALTEKDCISFFKERPTFTCLFKATKVPERELKFDSIRAEAKYIYKLSKEAVVEIRKTPELIA